MDYCFPPAGAYPKCKFLILGSRVTKKTIKNGFYYTSDCTFYKFLDSIFEESDFEETYRRIKAKLPKDGLNGFDASFWNELNQKLIKKGICLWDCITKFDADGARDIDTKEASLNYDLREYLANNPEVTVIINGKSTTKFSPLKLFKLINNDMIDNRTHALFSTSGAANKYSSERLNEWKRILKGY